VLPATHRLTRGHEFSLALRHGVRAGRSGLVVHLAAPRAASPGARAPHPLEQLRPTDPPRVGLVVSRAVGGSVVRHRVQRRLRHLVRPLLADLPAGSLVVVRALPAAAGRTSAELDAELRPALRSCLRKAAGALAPAGEQATVTR
jgi:ribonuclease P protein component